MMLLRPGDPREIVRLDLVYHDETWEVTDPMTRDQANLACRLFGEQAVPVRGRRVVRALIVPEVP